MPTFLAGEDPANGSVASMLDVSADGRWLLVSDPGGVRVRNVATGASTAIGAEFSSAAVFSPDMGYIAALRADGTLATIAVDLDGGAPAISTVKTVTAVPAVPAPAQAALAWQPAGTARFEHERVPGAPGTVDFRSLAVAPPGESIIMGGEHGEPAWTFGDGADSGGSPASARVTPTSGRGGSR